MFVKEELLQKCLIFVFLQSIFINIQLKAKYIRNSDKNIKNLQNHAINSGSYMSAHVLLNLLNELGKKDKMRGCAEHFTCFPQRV